MNKITLYLILCFLFTARLFGQKPSAPEWPSGGVEFNTAKIAIQNQVTDKYATPIYNDAHIVIDGTNMTVKIDIPNRFFMKYGILKLKNYVVSDNLVYVTYTATEGEKYIGLSFYYNEGENDPFQILFYGVDNINAKPQKRIVLLLTEFK